MIQRLQTWARAAKRDVVALWLAARDPRVGWAVKCLAALLAAYALSPIDLIPDFIPVLGMLDDALLLPIGVWLVVRLTPPGVMADLRERAAQMERPRSLAGAAAIAGLWLMAAAWFYFSVLR